MIKSMLKGILLTICLMFTVVAAQAQVYKTVDEHGNVVYTDQPPTPDAKPVQLRGLTVVPVPDPPTPKPVRARQGQADADGKVTDLGALRRGYRDFRLTQPLPEQMFAGTENMATVAWDTQYALQEGMRVIISVDGQAMAPTTDAVIQTERLDRGEHTVSAKLVDDRGRTVVSTSPVTFFVYQHSRNFNRPQVSPNRGGG